MCTYISWILFIVNLLDKSKHVTLVVHFTVIALVSNFQMTAVVSYAVFCVIVIGSHGFISGPSIPGGIHNVKVNDPGVIQAALFAVSSLGPGNSLIAVVKAKRQIVAGTNYFLWLRIWKLGFHQFCFAKVFRGLDGSKSSRWYLLTAEWYYFFK